MLSANHQLTARLAVVLVVAACPSVVAEQVAPYVQTVREDVELILDLAEIRPSDYLIDLGSGDGRFVIGAGKRGAMARGIELSSELVELSAKNARHAGVADLVAFTQGDIFAADIGAATVVTLYLFPEANLELRPKLLAELRPGTRVVSNSFHMGEWQPDRKAQGRTSGGALLWYIPADVRGTWELRIDSKSFLVQLEQEFQQVRSVDSDTTTPGSATRETMKPESARLEGTSFRFLGQIDGDRYLFQGRVEGDTMQGVAHAQSNSPKLTQKTVARWEAHRRNSRSNKVQK